MNTQPFNPLHTSTPCDVDLDMGDTFPDLGPMLFEPEQPSASPPLTHILNKDLTECTVCGATEVSNQMCHGPPAPAPTYINISSPGCGSECDPVEVANKIEREPSPVIDCYCKYQDPYGGCEMKFVSCPGNIPGTPALSVDGWLQRREEHPSTSGAGSPGPRDKPSLKQLDIRECLDPEHDIPEEIKEAVVSAGEGDSGSGKGVRYPRDICLAPRDTASADRELWAIRTQRRHVLKPGESRKIRTNLVLPRCRSPHHAAKIEGPAPHWTANKVGTLINIKQGVLDGRRSGRLHVDLYNIDEKPLVIQTGTVVGQFVREPLLYI